MHDNGSPFLVSSRPHSRYVDQPVSLLLISRKWFCVSPACSIKVFTERYEWLSPHGRRTLRAEHTLRQIAFSTSCLSAQKVAQSTHLPVSHDTLLTIILENHHPVVFLPDRLPQTLTEWLKPYSHVQVMSRDGFPGIRQGITNANPSIHVYDRWHFTGNAKKRLDFLLLSLVPSVMTWSKPNASVREIEMAEKRKKRRQEQKWTLIQEIQTAHSSGKSISRFAREYELDRKTVKKYLQMTSPPLIHR
ncbi:transposase [Bacillus smithii]|uniref:hypothetical protein n=1 Tax=Bacillus smithii TaxID=1479 RepID=UPI003D1BFD9F